MNHLSNRPRPANPHARISLALAFVAVALLIWTPAASATKYFDSYLGTTSASSSGLPPTPAGTAYGATFSSANGGIGDIAVNDPSITTDGTGQSGWIYVVDRGNNRIQAFDSNKNFQWAIGRDVIAPTVNEAQLLTVTAKSGQFKLEFNGQTTAADLAWNASAATIQAALRGLSSAGPVGNSNINVTGTTATASVPGTFAIAFVGTGVGGLAAANQNPITVQPGTTPLTGGNASISTVVDGTAATPGDQGAVWERCTIAVHCKAGVAGSLGGEFNAPQGIDIDQATGNFYVNERGNAGARVQQFQADGTFVRAFGWDVVSTGPGDDSTAPINEFETCNAAAGDVCKAGVAGAGTGQLGSTATNVSGLAVGPLGAPNAGQVYVADPQNRRILPFTVPTDPTSGVSAGASFGTATEFGNNPLQLAADRNGVVYVGWNLGAGNSISRYDTAAGAFLGSIVGNVDFWRDGNAGVAALEIDYVTDHLLLLRSGSFGIKELDLTDKPIAVELADVVDTHLAGLTLAGVTDVRGIATDASGRILVTTSAAANGAGSGVGHRVLVLDDGGVDPPPSVELLPPTNVGCTTATLQANINPNGPTEFPTSYRFQVSKTGIDNDWTDIAANQLVGSTGDGGSSVFIGDAGTGLEANTLYRVRVVTTRAPAAGVAISAELIFATDPCPVTAETIAATQVSDTAAQLNGRLNPNGITTNYWFEWGDNNYGNTIPVPAATATGAIARPVSARLSGLAPESVYHYRLCAQNSLSLSKVCGADATVTTRPATTAAEGRGYEIVTSPDKALRRGGDRGGLGADYSRFWGGLPSPDGEAVQVQIFGGVLDPESGNAFAHSRAPEIRRRTESGWRGHALFDVAPITGSSAAGINPGGFSADLTVQMWGLNTPLFASGSQPSVSADDDGGPRGGGWYPFLDPDWFTGSMNVYTNPMALVDDDGDRMVSWINQPPFFQDVRGVGDAAAPSSLSPAQTSGHALFLSGPPTWAPGDLVNECTGAIGSGATLLPRRAGTGAVTDTIGSRDCAAGSPTSVRGAALGSAGLAGGETGQLRGTATTAMSDDGKRVFFLSPDTGSSGAPAACVASVLAPDFSSIPQVDGLTDCPPQLFVRQFDSDGDPIVRWISRASDPLFNHPQRIGEMGGVSFEGSSRDGRSVYFRTSSPLTLDDPNGGNSQTDGVASPVSWDLYRYVLPASHDADPATGQLTRISAGPVAEATGDLASGSQTVSNVVTSSGAFAVGQTILGAGVPANTTVTDVGSGTLTLSNAATASAAGSALRGAADSNTNCTQASATCGGTSNGGSAVLRYLSDDGQRAYFVTGAPIPGADNSSPSGGATQAGGTASSNVTTRNLYLYDSSKSGAQAYRFVARIPFSTAADLDRCASSQAVGGGGSRTSLGLDTLVATTTKCVHGTTSGDAVVFETTGKLTPDDQDTASDVYLFNATEDELVRLSAPAAGSSPYPCLASNGGVPTAYCNGDLGMAIGDLASRPSSTPETVGLDGMSHENLAEDDQGRLRAVYFETRAPLVAGDTNGDHMDVYEWRDGKLSLMSPGTADHSAFFTGNSRDGQDVFFWTEEPIDAHREIDSADGDVYDAREGGGFPAPPSAPPACVVLADLCQGAGVGLVSIDPRTSSPGGGDGGSAGERKVLSVAGIGANARRVAVRTGRLSLRVSTTGAGRLSAVARGKVGKSRRVVARSAKSVARAGMTRVDLYLNGVARKALRRSGALRLSVRVQQPGARSRSMTVLLRRSGS